MYILPALEHFEAILQNSFPFWNKLSQLEKMSLLNNTSDFNYKKGALISGNGGSCAGVLLVLKGSLRAYILSDEGKDLTLFRLYPGGVCILSASCILKTIRFDVLIEAENDCRLLVINTDVFSHIANNNIWVENFSYKIASERFSDVIEAIQKIFFLSVDKRLANFLLEETDKHNDCFILLTHEQIAKYIGSAREVVTRSLKSFSELGILEISRGGIKIIDAAKLKDIAE
jgi:CRP/FNR family transcriptional regulator